MSISIKESISILISGISAIKNIIERENNKNALLQEVLEEIDRNIKIIQKDYLEKKCSIESIITILHIDKLKEAIAECRRNKFDFENIKKGLVDLNYLVNKYQIKYYQNYNTEKLLKKIYDKIVEIKDVKELYFKDSKWDKKVNPKLRMNTIVNLFELLSRHLNKK